jgi:hypothetical protein
MFAYVRRTTDAITHARSESTCRLSSIRLCAVFISPVYVLPLRFRKAYRVGLLARQHHAFHDRVLKAAVDERRSSQICAMRLVVTKTTSWNNDDRMSEPARSAPEKSVPRKSFQHRFDSRRSQFRNETRLISERPKNVRGNVRSDKSRASASRVLKTLKPSGSLSSCRGSRSGVGRRLSPSNKPSSRKRAHDKS